MPNLKGEDINWSHPVYLSLSIKTGILSSLRHDLSSIAFLANCSEVQSKGANNEKYLAVQSIIKSARIRRCPHHLFGPAPPSFLKGTALRDILLAKADREKGK